MTGRVRTESVKDLLIPGCEGPNQPLHIPNPHHAMMTIDLPNEAAIKQGPYHEWHLSDHASLELTPEQTPSIWYPASQSIQTIGIGWERDTVRAQRTC